MRALPNPKPQNHHQTHHLFLTRRALYVIAFDINKYRPQHFKQQIMFFVSKLQSRVPAAPVVLVGTHADMVNEEEANERCAHVLSMLTRKQQRERRRLLAQIEERQKQIAELEKSGAATEKDEIEQRRQHIDQLKQQLGRFIKLPSKAIAVSSAESMLNIDELRESIKQTALDKELFPQMGEKIPRLYEQTRALIREWRDQTPYCDLGALVDRLRVALELEEKEEEASGRVHRALDFLHDVGELIMMKTTGLVFLSLQWLVDVNKQVIRHDHSDALIYEEALQDLMTPNEFKQAKSDLLRRGRLSITLLRWLWRDLKLDDSTFERLVLMLQQFEVATLSKTTDAHEQGHLLVPAFFPDYLPPSCWPKDCPENQVQVWRWFEFAESSPAGLIQRLQVNLYSQWPEEEHILAKEGMVLMTGMCRMIFKLVEAGDGAEGHEGLALMVRGPPGEGESRESL